MSERPKISAVVHTYNSERHLEECLSALEVFDEILVIDMESSDRTVDIANSHGARVIIKERSEHRLPEAYRNFGLQAAKYDWVLVVNDDEIVPRALADYLYDDLERNPEPHAVMIPTKNYFMGRWMHSYYPDYILRFFNRVGATWPFEIHSTPAHQGPEVFIPAKRTDLAYIHLANETVWLTIARMNNYTDREKARCETSYSPLKLFYEPPCRFFKSYVLKGGFRDGWPGFIHAVHDAIYSFVALSKIQESRETDRSGKNIDRDVAANT